MVWQKKRKEVRAVFREWDVDEESCQWLAQSLAIVHPGHSWLAELT
jgi:hypothetical protein